MRRKRQSASVKSPRANIIWRHGRRMGELPSSLDGDGLGPSWSFGHQDISWPACEQQQRQRQRDQDDDALKRQLERETKANRKSDNSSGFGDKMTMTRLNKCRRRRHFVACSPSIVMFAILAQFTSLNQQIATSNAHQTNQPQLRIHQQQQQQQQQISTQQPQRHWRNGSFIVSDLINQARGQQVEESSQKQATTMMTSVDKQQPRNTPQAPVQQPVAMVLPSAAVAASARGHGTSATAPSDNEFELSDSASGSSTPASEEMAADEEHEEAGSDDNENGAAEDQAADATDQPNSGASSPPQIDRRHDDGQPADTFEGIQLKPSRRSHNAGSIPHGAATLTTLRTMVVSQPETTPNLLTRPRPNDVNTSPMPPTTTPNINPLGASFDVNMGADRMLIKPADELETRLLLSSSPSPLPPASTEPTSNQMRHHQINNFDSQMNGGSSHELAHESVIHNQRELFDGSATTPTAFNATAHQQRNPQQNDQHQVMMLATNNVRLNTNFNQQQFIGDPSQTQHELAFASICYTPLSLLLVILATILITLLISLGAYHLFKYLKRHQFDLVANSKHFDHKHLSSSSNGYSQGAATGRSLASAQSYLRPANNHPNELPLGGASATSACTLHLFQADESCQKCRTAVREQQARVISNVSSYAFRNPYFTDDQQQQQLPTGGSGGRRVEGASSLEQRMWQAKELADSARGSPKPSPAGGYFNPSGSPGGFLAPTASSSEQMHFIESHIADLHNRQVTSSVKELSSFGADTATAQVVDLTSKEQQDRIRAHPREGDLVAIDLTGHDIIGLGFDVCGNQRDGIFVRSVSSHGPARESGCIQAGDRIKCINVSFESVTLQDACDILNAGAPYKLRLLIEKKVATMSELDKMQHSSNRPTWNQSAEQQQRRRPMMMMHANNSMGLQQPLSAPDLSHRTGPLEATRNRLGRWLGLLTGTRSEEARLVIRMTDGHRQQVEDEFQLHNQRVMTMANNPLLMMSQYKQALPASGGGGQMGGNLYKLSPIGALAAGGVGPTFGPDNPLASSQRDNNQLASDNLAKRTNGTSSNEIKYENETPPRGPRRKLSASGQNERDKITGGDLPKSQQAQPDQDQDRRKARPRVESCHSNGAFCADEVDGTSCHINGGDRNDDDVDLKAVHEVDKYLHRGDSSDMENVVCLHDEDYDNVDEGFRQHRKRHQEADHEQDAEGLNNDELHGKLMASGEKFNTKSRLTM